MGKYFQKNFIWLFTSLWFAENLGLFKRWRPRYWDYPYTNSYAPFQLWFYLIYNDKNFIFFKYFVKIWKFILNWALQIDWLLINWRDQIIDYRIRSLKFNYENRKCLWFILRNS